MRPQLAALAVIALAGEAGGFVAVAPNRLMSGRGVAIWSALPPALLAAMLGCSAVLAAGAWRGRRAGGAIVAGAAAMLLLLALQGAGDAADALASGPATRVLLGPGFWTLLFAASLGVAAGLQASGAPRSLRALTVLSILCGTAWLASEGRFDRLSLAREYASHAAAFGDAIGRHLLLVGLTLALTLGLGVPAGVLLQRRRRWRAPAFAVLNVVQTLPSIALFGLLMAPLAAGGLSGIGVVPALVALVLYALLPVLRSVVAGLDGVDPAVLDAASGLGLSQGQILRQVGLPLAWPALLAGLRLVTVQTIGLAVVVALIGAGGLGDFVFQGLGQSATDLVLLGALPAIGLALAADALLGGLERAA